MVHSTLTLGEQGKTCLLHVKLPCVRLAVGYDSRVRRYCKVCRRHTELRSVVQVCVTAHPVCRRRPCRFFGVRVKTPNICRRRRSNVRPSSKALRRLRRLHHDARSSSLVPSSMIMRVWPDPAKSHRRLHINRQAALCQNRMNTSKNVVSPSMAIWGRSVD